jgi:hypothetical protein
MRETAQILQLFKERTGFQHPSYETGPANYEGLLRASGRSENEIAGKMTPFPPAGPAEE